tara:strand:- start:306 stop:509 length:204 start_codon:yes stop_codon:yes gene_type:complete
MIRKQLANAISVYREDNNKTYSQMVEITGLNKNQLIRVIKQEGYSVSVDLMEAVCDTLGLIVKLEIK